MVTVGLVEPQRLADTVNVPGESAVVCPFPVVSMLGRIVVFEMFQVTKSVTSVVPVIPLNVAVASKVKAAPLVIVACVPLSTFKTMLWTTGQTVTMIPELVTEPSEAVTVVVPGKVPALCKSARLAAVKSPELPLNEATVGLDELQTAWPFTFPVLPSSKVAVAVICWVVVGCMERFCGPTASEVTVGFTKNPRQLMPKAKVASARNAPVRRSF